MTDNLLEELGKMRKSSKNTIQYDLDALKWRMENIKTLVTSKEDLVPHHQEKLDFKNCVENICRHYETITLIDGIKRRLKLYYKEAKVKQ